MTGWLQRLPKTDLQQRLLLLLLTPLLALLLVNSWLEYRLADSATIQQDRQLLTLVAQFSEALTGDGNANVNAAGRHLHLQLPEDLAEFLASRPQTTAYALLNAEGSLLAGDEWLRDYPPETLEPEFSSQEYLGVTYRIVTQRLPTRHGELTARLADGANLRLQRLEMIALRVLLPNLLLAVATVFSVHWAVRRALRPLGEMRLALEMRSSRDLTPLDAAGAPQEVRPLVESLNRLFALVASHVEAQRRFVADAAHQLRTPLAGLQAQVEALAQAGQGGSPAQIQKLRDSTRRTSQLTSQLLSLSRAEAPGVAEQPFARVDLPALLEEVLAAHLDQAAARQIDLGLEADPVAVDGHQWLLRELLNNLVDNALRYCAPGGHVTLRCGRLQQPELPAGPVVGYLQVEDDGPGVPESERSRVLQRFYRLPGAASQGSGLGLAIADEIARAHDSALRLESGSFGRGLRVSLHLQAVRE